MKNNRYSVFIWVVVASILLMSTTAVAHTGEDELAVGKELVEEGASCDNLGDEQLEAIGEYLMEQMHPGEAHELMHQMMGIAQGTSYHDQFHVNLAQAMYCDTATGGADAATGGSGMMGAGGMMPMMRMMPMMSAMAGQGAQGMMGSFGYGSYGSGYSNLVNVLYVVLLLGLIGLVYFWLLKMWKGTKKHGK